MSERKRAPRKELPLHEYNRLFLVEQSYAGLKESVDKLQFRNNELLIRNAALFESKKSIEKDLGIFRLASAIGWFVVGVLSAALIIF